MKNFNEMCLKYNKGNIDTDGNKKEIDRLRSRIKKNES